MVFCTVGTPTVQKTITLVKNEVCIASNNDVAIEDVLENIRICIEVIIAKNKQKKKAFRLINLRN